MVWLNEEEPTKKNPQSLCPFAVGDQEQSQPTAPEMVHNKQCIFQTLEWFIES